MSFEFQPMKIPGMVLVVPKRHEDARGFFQESYRMSQFRDGGIDADFVQDNFARSAGGVLRGLHFQLPPRPQGKLVSVLRGEVFDVGVDLRTDSPTYGEWEGVTLDDQRGALLYLPPGLAHGYAVLSSEADLAYKVTEEYEPELDAGVRWDDPDIGIRWPLDDPTLSERDKGLPLLAETASPFRMGGNGP